MTTILFILQIVITLILVISVLLQKSSSIGLGAYSGSNESLFGAKGPAGFLAKFTAIMAIIFVANTITLGYFYQKDQDVSIIDTLDLKKENLIPKTQQNSAPVAPKSN